MSTRGLLFRLGGWALHYCTHSESGIAIELLLVQLYGLAQSDICGSAGLNRHSAWLLGDLS